MVRRLLSCGLACLAMVVSVCACQPPLRPTPPPTITPTPTLARSANTPVPPTPQLSPTVSAVAPNAVATSAAASGPTPTRAPSFVATVTPDLNGRRMTLTLFNYRFGTSTLTARAGQPIRLTLENKDALAHEFVIDNSDLAVSVEARTSQQVDFIITKPGSYIFSCNLILEGDHRALGMIGTLIVEP